MDKTATPEHRGAIEVAMRWHRHASTRFAMLKAMGKEAAEVPGLLDVTLCLLMAHRNGSPLNWVGLMNAPHEELDHDVGGILTHVDRRTGKVGGLFAPRHSAVTP